MNTPERETGHSLSTLRNRAVLLFALCVAAGSAARSTLQTDVSPPNSFTKEDAMQSFELNAGYLGDLIDDEYTKIHDIVASGMMLIHEKWQEHTAN